MPQLRIRRRSDVEDRILQNIADVCCVSLDQIEDIYDCTPVQAAIAADTMRLPGAYVDEIIYRIEPSLDLDRLSDSLRRLVSLNAVFRTRIVYTEIGLLQVVVDESPHVERPTSSLESYLEDVHSKPMLLTQPLLRLALVDQKLVFTVHHVIYDFETALLAINDLALMYKGVDPAPRTPFKSFVDHCLDIDEASASEFWNAQFDDLSTAYPMLPSPDHVAPQGTKEITKSISLGKSARTRGVGGRDDVPSAALPSIIELAWSLTAAIYAGSDCVTFGNVFSGRSNTALSGLETTMGPTIAAFPVQVSLREDMSVGEMIRKLSQRRRQIRAHPAVQWGVANIGTASEKARCAARFNALLNILDVEERVALPAGFEIHSSSNGPQVFSIVLAFLLERDHMTLECEFDPSVLSEQQMNRVLRQFEHGFNWLISGSPTRKLSQFERLNLEDLLEINTWNSRLPPAIEGRVDRLFSVQADRTPDAIAVTYGSEDTMTYRDLDRQSTLLAAKLRRCGISQASSVPIIFEKSLWSVVAILAILKADGVCVPLEPSHPEARKRYIISTVRANVMLTSAAAYDSSINLTETVIAVTPSLMSELTDPELPAYGQFPPAHPAYILFTSGSTGKPKGVVIEHSNLNSSIKRFAETIQLKQGESVLQFSAYIWDVSVLEIFTPLLLGARICVPSEDARNSNLGEFIHSTQVDHVILTPTVARTLSPSDVPNVKTLMLGGEPTHSSDIEIWASNVQLFVAWGLAETTVFSTARRQLPETASAGSIGTPKGCIVWIADSRNINRLAPIGSVGELVVEGPNVASGYLDDDAKTVNSFISPPMWAPIRRKASPLTRRFFRTGDQARYGPDGDIRLIGRLDNQVKLRGQRFDLGEVEACFSSRAEVGDCLAIVFESRARQKRELAVFVTLKHPGLPRDVAFKEIPGASEHVHEIRQHVQSKLPSYMVPTVWLAVERIPRTPSQKLDRVAGRDWLIQEDESGRLFAEDTGASVVHPPVTRIECLLQQMWASALGVSISEIGRESSFLRLGGDSISAMQVVTRCLKKDLKVPVSALLRGESIEATALNCQFLNEDQEGEQVQDNIEGQVTFPLSPMQELLAARSEVNLSGHSSRTLKLQLKDDVDDAKIERALHKLVNHHSILRARFSVSEDGRWKQRIVPDKSAGWHFQKYEVSDESQFENAVEAARTSVDMIDGPVFAASLIRVNDNDINTTQRRLLLTANDLVVDSGSWKILREHFSALLEDSSKSLPAGCSFDYWIRRLSQQIDDTSLENVDPRADLAYWRDSIEGHSPVEPMSARLVLESTVTNTLLHECNIPFNTQPSDLILAASIWSFRQVFLDRGLPDLYIKYDGHAQTTTLPDASHTVGFLEAYLPLGFSVWDGSMDCIERTVTLTKDCSRTAHANVGTTSFRPRILGNDKPLEHSEIEIAFDFTQLKVSSAKNAGTKFTTASSSYVQRHELSESTRQIGGIDVSAHFDDTGKLCIAFRHDRRIAHQNRIKRWMSTLRDCLSRIAKEFPAKKPVLTSSDIELTKASHMDLHKIQAKLEKLSIEAGQVETIYPCSPIQESMLFAQNRNWNDVYLTRFFFRLNLVDCDESFLDPDRLERAWSQICNRYAILRTVFVDDLCDTGSFYQVVLKKYATATSILPSSSDALSSLRFLSRPNLPAAGPPHHLVIAPQSSSVVYVMLYINHAIYDYPTIRLLANELAVSYSKTAQKKSSYDFPDYIRWLNVQQDSDKRREDPLLDVKPCLVPTKAQSPIDEIETANRTIHVSLSDLKAVQSLCHLHHLTLSQVVQVAWGLVLRCLTEAPSSLFAYLHSGRHSFEGIEQIVGPTIRSLICKLEMSPTGTVVQLLKKMANDTATALDQRNHPVGASHQSAGASHYELLNTVVSIVSAWSNDFALANGIRVELADVEGASEYAISVMVILSKDEMSARLVYRSSDITDSLAMRAAALFGASISRIAEVTDNETIDSFVSAIEMQHPA